MIRTRIALFLLTGLIVWPAASAEVYLNNFNDPSTSLNNFVFGNVGSSSSSYGIGITNGQLQIAPGSPEPSGAYAAIDSSSFLSPYTSVLHSSPGLVTWAFNLWNQNGNLNNAFSLAVASSAPDARVYTSSSYVFEGGGYVGNDMALYRQIGPAYGGPSFTPIIDVPNGLAPFPQVGSFKITYDPVSNRWSLYGVMGTTPINPETVTNLLGTAIDNTLTGISLPYVSLSARTTGLASFDNLSVNVAPEPSSARFLIGVLIVVFGLKAKQSRCSKWL
jgi:hypothetical protein